jgi:hypothetical protein
MISDSMKIECSWARRARFRAVLEVLKAAPGPLTKTAIRLNPFYEAPASPSGAFAFLNVPLPGAAEIDGRLGV